MSSAIRQSVPLVPPSTPPRAPAVTLFTTPSPVKRQWPKHPRTPECNELEKKAAAVPPTPPGQDSNDYRQGLVKKAPDQEKKDVRRAKYLTHKRRSLAAFLDATAPAAAAPAAAAAAAAAATVLMPAPAAPRAPKKVKREPKVMPAPQWLDAGRELAKNRYTGVTGEAKLLKSLGYDNNNHGDITHLEETVTLGNGSKRKVRFRPDGLKRNDAGEIIALCEVKTLRLPRGKHAGKGIRKLGNCRQQLRAEAQYCARFKIPLDLVLIKETRDLKVKIPQCVQTPYVRVSHYGPDLVRL